MSNNGSNELEKELNKIPINLSKTNPSFQHLVEQVLSQIASSMTIDEHSTHCITYLSFSSCTYT